MFDDAEHEVALGGLSPTATRILLHLYLIKGLEQRARHVTAIANVLQRSKGFVSEALTQLEGDGLVHSETEKNLKNYTLTERGEILAQAIRNPSEIARLKLRNQLEGVRHNPSAFQSLGRSVDVSASEESLSYFSRVLNVIESDILLDVNGVKEVPVLDFFELHRYIFAGLGQLRDKEIGYSLYMLDAATDPMLVPPAAIREAERYLKSLRDNAEGLIGKRGVVKQIQDENSASSEQVEKRLKYLAHAGKYSGLLPEFKSLFTIALEGLPEQVQESVLRLSKLADAGVLKDVSFLLPKGEYDFDHNAKQEIVSKLNAFRPISDFSNQIDSENLALAVWLEKNGSTRTGRHFTFVTHARAIMQLVKDGVQGGELVRTPLQQVTKIMLRQQLKDNRAEMEYVREGAAIMSRLLRTIDESRDEIVDILSSERTLDGRSVLSLANFLSQYTEYYDKYFEPFVYKLLLKNLTYPSEFLGSKFSRKSVLATLLEDEKRWVDYMVESHKRLQSAVNEYEGLMRKMRLEAGNDSTPGQPSLS